MTTGNRVGHEPWWKRAVSEPRRPEWIREREDAPWLVVACVCIGAFMGQLDVSIVTVAMPALRGSFGGSLGSVEWVTLAYLLVLVSFVAPVGRVADVLGRKLVYCYGFAVFALGSAACGFAPNLPTLVIFRAVQAIGAAMLQANSVALIATALPRGRLGRGIGIQGAAQALGLALGPSVGGALVSLAGWRWIFFVNVPVGACGVALGLLLLPRTRDLSAHTRFDWPGLASLVPATAALPLALSYGRDLGFARPVVVVFFAIAVLGFAAFSVRELRAAVPLVDLTLFRTARFTAGIASGLLSYAVLFGVLFALPFQLELGLGLRPGVGGLTLTVVPAAIGITAPIAGRLADRHGPRLFTVGGMAATAIGLAVLAAGQSRLGAVCAALALVGVGIGSFTPPNNASIMASAPRVQAGVAGGLLNMTRGLGTALGVALAGVTLDVGTREHGSLRGFTATSVLLASLALAAGLIALAERPGAPVSAGTGSGS